MLVQWLYALEALVALLGLMAAVLFVRGVSRRKSTGRGGWKEIAFAGLSLVALGVLAILVIFAHRPLDPAIHQTGHSLEEFRFQSVQDDSWHSLGEYRGKVVLLNVWATWCGPCRGEIPELERTQRELGPKGVVVLMVSNEKPSPIREFLARHPVATAQGYVFDGPGSSSFTAIDSRPLSFIVDRQGIVRKFLIGPGDSNRFSRLIRQYL